MTRMDAFLWAVLVCEIVAIVTLWTLYAIGVIS